MNESLFVPEECAARIVTAHNNAMTALAVADQPAGPIEAWEKQMQEDLDALVEHANAVEKTVAVLLAVLPRMIVEAAQDFHTSYMDGRQPELSEAGLRARFDRILRNHASGAA